MTRFSKLKLKSVIKHFFLQVRTLRRAVVHPQVPWHAKMVAACAFLYVVSPIQLIPNFLPIIGQADDVLVITVALRYLERSIPKVILDDLQSSGPVRSLVHPNHQLSVVSAQS